MCVVVQGVQSKTCQTSNTDNFLMRRDVSLLLAESESIDQCGSNKKILNGKSHGNLEITFVEKSRNLFGFLKNFFLKKSK